MHARLRLLAVGLMAVSAAVAAGCGGGGQSTSGAESTVAKQAQSGESTGAQRPAPQKQNEPDGSTGGGGANAEAEAPGGSGSRGGRKAPQAGHGESGRSSEATPSAPSAGANGASPAKARFVKEATVICRRQSKEAFTASGDYVRQRLGRGKSEAALQAEAIKTKFLPAIEQQIEELAALTPPPGDAAKVSRILTAMRTGLAQAKRRNYTASNVESFGEEFRPVVKPATEYNLAACAIV